MNGMLDRRRLPMAVFLFVCVTPICEHAPAFAQSAPARPPQQFMCWPIAQGDTASELSRRLMGSTAAAYSDAFQIRDPARKMFVPKSRYRRLSTEWQACVATEPVKSTPRAYAPVVALGAPVVAEDPSVTSTPLTPPTMTSAPRPIARAGVSPLDFIFAS